MSAIPLTYDDLIRIGVIAARRWPGLTAACEIQVIPYTPGLLDFHVVVHRPTDTLLGYYVHRNVRLDHYSRLDAHLLHEWFMGADEELDVLIVMRAEYLP